MQLMSGVLGSSGKVMLVGRTMFVVVVEAEVEVEVARLAGGVLVGKWTVKFVGNLVFLK